MNKRKCLLCNKEFNYYISMRPNAKFCSRKCSIEYCKENNIGAFFNSNIKSETAKRTHKEHPEMMQKIAETNRKNKKSCFHNKEQQIVNGLKGGNKTKELHPNQFSEMGRKWAKENVFKYDYGKEKWYRINGKMIKESHLKWIIQNYLHRIPFVYNPKQDKNSCGCIIHHIDGNRENNNQENLQLMTNDFHIKLHREYNQRIKSCLSDSKTYDDYKLCVNKQ